MSTFNKFGNWLFHYRNIIFPLLYCALFIPSDPIFQDGNWALVTGLTLITTGIAIRCITIGLAYIIRGGIKRRIYAGTLVTSGIYKVCRNPMYLGNIFLLTGFGTLVNSKLSVLLFIPLFIFIYVAIIRAEETFLSKKFGQQFIEYKSRSNMFLPRLKYLKNAFKGHTFNWIKVVNKEYNSLFLYLSGILLYLLFSYHIEIGYYLIIQISVLLLYILIKYLKHKKRLIHN